ncbi:YecA family protein, partial [Hyphomonas oceanitis]
MRKLTDEGLARLDHFLVSQEDDEVMMVPELDGFLTGLLVCPEMILPSVWLPVVWGGDGPVFEDQTEANEILGLIMALYWSASRKVVR